MSSQLVAVVRQVSHLDRNYAEIMNGINWEQVFAKFTLNIAVTTKKGINKMAAPVRTKLVFISKDGRGRFAGHDNIE